MGYCRNCGESLRAGAHFCACCGAGAAVMTPGAPQPSPSPAPYPRAPHPTPPPSAAHAPSGPVVAPAPSRLVAPIALVVGAAVVVAVVVGFVVLPRSVTTSGTVFPATAVGPVPGTAQSRPAPVPASRPTEQVGQDDLDRQVAADRATAESLVGSWVPQLSSRQLGMVIGGATVDAAAVLSNFAGLKGQFPDSVLVRSDDYSSFRQGGYWVTLVANPFASAAEANAWCDSAGRGPDDCFAKRLSHTDGPAGNTAHR